MPKMVAREACTRGAPSRPPLMSMPVERVIIVLLVFLGALLKVGLAWDIADVLMGFMAIINLPVIVILSSTGCPAGW